MSFTFVKAAPQASGGSSTTSRTVTFGSAVAAGNLIVAMCINYDLDGTPVTAITFSDNQTGPTNTWLPAHTIMRSDTVNGQAIQIGYTIAGTSTAMAVTANWTGASGAIDNQLQVFEFSFTGATPSVDATRFIKNQTSTNPTMSLATLEASDLGVAVVAYATATPTAGSGFTMPYNGGAVAPGGNRLEYKANLGAAGATAFPWTSATSQAWEEVAVAFRDVAAASPIQWVQNNQLAGGSGTTAALAFASNVTFNNLLLACCITFDTTARSPTFLDSMGNTWSLAHTVWQPATSTFGGYGIQWGWAIVGAGAQATPCQVTASWGGNNVARQMQVFEFSGAESASVVDVTGTSATVGGDPAGVVTTATANCLGLATIVQATTAPTAAPGWTIPFTGGSPTGGSQKERIAYRTNIGGIGPQQFPFYNSAAADAWSMLLLAIKPSSGPVTPPLSQYYPGSDISNAGSWTKSTGGTTVLYSMIDDVAADTTGADYIQSPVNPTTAVCEIKFSGVQQPSATTNHSVKLVIKRDNSTTLRVDLINGNAGGSQIVKTWTYSGAGDATYTTKTETFTPSDGVGISDYSDLRLRFTAG